MAIQFDRPENAEPTLAGSLSKGINRILESKIADLKKKQGIQERKDTYKKADLPEWLAELPEEMQKLFIKEYQFLPEEEKAQVDQQLQNIGQQYWSDWSPQEQEQPQQQGILPQQLQQVSKSLQQAPGMRALEGGTIPGLNNLTQAGEGFVKEPGRSQEAQSFPQRGKGIMGQVGPQEVNIPRQEVPTKSKEIGPKKYKMVPRKTGEGNLATAKFEASQQKQRFAEQKSIRPFLDKEFQDIRAQNQSADIAEKMLHNIKKNKAKWPGFIKGNLSRVAGENVIRDPEVRKYIADAHSLVAAQANTRRGLPTNYKLKLEALSKADLSQPYETQVALLEDVIAKRDEARARQRYIDSQKDQQGNYPLDLPERVTKFDDAMDNPLEHPEFFKNGDEYEDDNGINHVIKNGKWVKA